MSNPRKHDDAVKYVITLTEPFTVGEVQKRLPSVPSGTLSGIVSSLRTGGALQRTPGSNGTPSSYRATTRMPKSLDGARAMMARARYTTRARRKTTRRGRRGPLGSDTQLVSRLKEWQRKAAILDALVADLGLTPADLQPYAADA